MHVLSIRVLLRYDENQTPRLNQPSLLLEKLTSQVSKKPATAQVWSLDSNDMLDDELELIDESDLLNEEDLAKPDPASLLGK